MFANEDFIAASRKFVCIRIETYESKEAEAKVRSLLNGAYANTSFCIFDPQGEERLTRSGRGPTSAVSGGRGRRSRDSDTSDAGVIRSLNRIAASYEATGRKDEVVLQEFHSFRQALNVASADQRLLILVDAETESREALDAELKKVFANEKVVGKFHLVFADPTGEENWKKNIEGETSEKGVYIIRSGQFGLEGEVVGRLSNSSNAETIKSDLLAANEKFAQAEDRKVYREHVADGRRKRIYFENEIPYGEDRDGDGEIDNARQRRRR